MAKLTRIARSPLRYLRTEIPSFQFNLTARPGRSHTPPRRGFSRSLCGSLVPPSSLAEPVGSLGKHLQAIETLASSDVKRALVGSGERNVRGLARHPYCAEVLTRAVEHLHTTDGCDVHPAV